MKYAVKLWKSVEKPKMHIPQWKEKASLKGYFWYYHNYATFWKRQNIEKVTRSGVTRDSGEGRECVSGAQRICRGVELFCMEYEWSGNLKLLLFYNFISLFLAVPSLSLCGLLPHCGEWAYSLVVARALLGVASLVAEHRLRGVQASGGAGCRLSSWGSHVLEHTLRSCGTWAYLLWDIWDLPRSVIKPVSSVLLDRFANTELPEKLSFKKKKKERKKMVYMYHYGIQSHHFHGK